MQVTVRTLDGHMLVVDVAAAAPRVRDVRRALTHQHRLRKCSLFLQSQQLSMDTLLADLPLQGGHAFSALTEFGAAVATETRSPHTHSSPSCHRVASRA